MLRQKAAMIIFLVIVFFFSFLFKIGYIYMSNNLSGGIAPDTLSYLRYSDVFLHLKFMEPTGVSKYDGRIARLPGFPAYLALVRTILIKDSSSPNSYMSREVAIQYLDSYKNTLRIISIIMFSICSVIVCYIVLKLFGWKAALISGPFAIGSPSIAFWSHWILTESLFTLLLLISILCIIKFSIAIEKKMFTICISGLIFGYASLTRHTLPPMFIVIISWFLLHGFISKNISFYIKVSSIFIVSFALIYGGWSARNTIVLGNMNLSAGESAFEAGKQRLFRTHTPDSKNNMEIKKIKFYQEYSKFPLEKKTKYIFKAMFIKFKEFWSITLMGTHQSFRNSTWIKYHVLFYCFSFPFMLLSLLFIAKDESNIILLCWFILFYFTAVHTILMAGGGISSRYRVPIEPYMSILTSYGVFHFYNWISSSRKKLKCA